MSEWRQFVADERRRAITDRFAGKVETARVREKYADDLEAHMLRGEILRTLRRFMLAALILSILAVVVT